jgi:hypothetical protein
LAAEAVLRLVEKVWFPSYAGSSLQQAVAGVESPFLALFELETDQFAAGWGGEF